MGAERPVVAALRAGETVTDSVGRHMRVRMYQVLRFLGRCFEVDLVAPAPVGVEGGP